MTTSTSNRLAAHLVGGHVFNPRIRLSKRWLVSLVVAPLLFPISALPAREIEDPTGNITAPTNSIGIPVRIKLVNRTASQTTDQVIQDLGNLFCSTFCAFPNFAGEQSIGLWAVRLPANVKVRRLIQEGRSQPNTIVPSLKDQMSDWIQAYPVARENRQTFDQLAAAQDAPWRFPLNREIDPYYESNQKYEDPAQELNRLLYSIYNGFYVLANLNALGDSTLLAEWIRTDRPEFSRISPYCADLQLWLVGVCYQQAVFSGNSDAIGPLNDFLQLGISTDKQLLVSEWTNEWNLMDPIVHIAGPDLGSIPTFEILEVPPAVLVGIPTKEERDAIVQGQLDKFLAWADSTSRQ